MAKRKMSDAQRKALARGRAKLKAMRRRGETPKRKTTRRTNPLKNGYSRTTVSDNIARLQREGMPAGRASAAALRNARNAWRKSHPRGAYPTHLKPRGKAPSRRRNPIDPALMRTKMLTSDFKSGRARPRVGRTPNPPHYVIRTANGAVKYFDGAGWVTGKNNAAQFITKAKASQIGHKVANATGKAVYVEAV